MFKNIKAATLLDRKIQSDRHELKTIQNNLTRYFDQYPYQLGGLVMGSCLVGFMASFFLKEGRLVKIINSPYLKTFRALLQYIPMLI